MKSKKKCCEEVFSQFKCFDQQFETLASSVSAFCIPNDLLKSGKETTQWTTKCAMSNILKLCREHTFKKCLRCCGNKYTLGSALIPGP